MELQREREFDARRGRSALAQRLLASGPGEPLHAEDAFLADFARFVRAADPEMGPAWLAIEVGRAALDLVDDVEGPWQGLPVAIWLDALARALTPSPERLRPLARAFVEWLVMRGRLSLHGQRRLVRGVAAWRVACDRAAH